MANVNPINDFIKYEWTKQPNQKAEIDRMDK